MIVYTRKSQCSAEKSLMATLAENKAIAGRWFEAFWGKRSDPDVIEELSPTWCSRAQPIKPAGEARRP